MLDNTSPYILISGLDTKIKVKINFETIPIEREIAGSLVFPSACKRALEIVTKLKKNISKTEKRSKLLAITKSSALNVGKIMVKIGLDKTKSPTLHGKMNNKTSLNIVLTCFFISIAFETLKLISGKLASAMADIKTFGIFINGKIIPVSMPYKLVAKVVTKPLNESKFTIKNESKRLENGKSTYATLTGTTCLIKFE